MKVFSVDLQTEYTTKGGELRAFLADVPFNVDDGTWVRPAVIVVPGGGYTDVSKREGEPIALAFLSLGFHAFVLEYAVAGEQGFSYPEQLIELASSVDYVRKNAKKLRVNPDEIFVVGASAGGHLVGNLAVEYQEVSKKVKHALDSRPTGIALCYPVVTKEGHRGSFDALLHGYSDEEKGKLSQKLELHNAVTQDTPPAFLWAMAKDRGVKVDKNVMLYAQACAVHDVDFELHIYPQGHHGSSTGRLEINLNKQAYLKRTVSWVENCTEFFRSYCVEEF